MRLNMKTNIWIAFLNKNYCLYNHPEDVSIKHFCVLLLNKNEKKVLQIRRACLTLLDCWAFWSANITNLRTYSTGTRSIISNVFITRIKVQYRLRYVLHSRKHVFCSFLQTKVIIKTSNYSTDRNVTRCQFLNDF